MNKALYLDRDGIINKDHGYVHKIKDFEFVTGIFELCQQAIEKGFKIFVITNQAGIARGYYDIATFEVLSKWMTDKFAEQNITIEKVFFCPHHPNKGVNEFVQHCDCRKPKPGMIFQAAKEFSINNNLSIFIGDKMSDMQAAENAGIKHKILVDSRYHNDDESTLSDINKVSTLADALVFIN